MTADGQLVILDKQTLEKAKIHTQINKTNFNDFKDLNISDYHPLGKQFGHQKILTLDVLLKIMEPLNVVVILNANRTNAAFVEKFKQAIAAHDPMFTKKIIFCCRSSIIIYKVKLTLFINYKSNIQLKISLQLRKIFPNLMCAVWMDNLSAWREHKRIYKLLTIVRSINDVIFRNIIAPIIGISLVFVHKDEFNT